MTATLAGIGIGIGLAASAGFRVFLPLLALSAAGYFGLLPLDAEWQWVSSPQALTVLSAATVIEAFAYFVPWLDNLLDAIAWPLASLAGVVVMASTSVAIDPVWQWALAIIAGGGTASVIKGINAKTRLAATATTAGLANPLIAMAETAFSALLSALAIFLWPLAMLLVAALLVAIFLFYRKLRNYWKRKTRRAAASANPDAREPY